MSSIFEELGGITGGVAAEGLAFAAGFAAGRALEPAAVTISQDAWHAAPVKRLGPETAAEAAAENYATYDVMAAEASYSGYDASRFAYIYDVTLTAPGVGELLNMLRRGTINPGNFTHGLRKAKLEPMWDNALANLQNVYPSPDILAVYLQRNVIPNQGQLPNVNLDTTGRVPRYPQVELDAYALAKTFGWSPEQLDAQTRIQGLPPGMDLVARMVYRNILDRGDFNLAAEQSNRRVEWADFEFEGYRQIPTAEQFVEAHLRGWITQAQMYAGTALHGMSQADTDLEYQIHRRPMTVHQITQALAWGGQFQPEAGEIQDPYVASVHQANLGPEWYDLAEHLKYTTPSYFVLRALLQAGTITETEGETYFLRLGWPPDLAAKAAAQYSTGTAAKADPHVAKAQTQLWTTTHTEYKKDAITAAQAEAALPFAGVSASAIPQIIEIWNVERGLLGEPAG